MRHEFHDAPSLQQQLEEARETEVVQQDLLKRVRAGTASVQRSVAHSREVMNETMKLLAEISATLKRDGVHNAT